MPSPLTPALGGGGAYTSPTLNYTAPTTAFDVSTPGGLSAVTDYINRLNRQGQSAANLARIPGEAGLEEQSSANIGSELRGQLPPDVLRLIAQQGAERGVAGGFSGSPNANAAYLQSLGLTSLDLTERGQRDLSGAVARNPAAPLFDPTTQMITPYQQGQLGLSAAEAQLRAEEESQRLATEAELQRERISAEQASAGARFGGSRTATAPPALGEFGGESVYGALDRGPSLEPAGTPTTRWLGSLGYTTAGVPTGTTGPGSFYAGSLEGGPAESPTPGFYAGEGPTAAEMDAVFWSDLGIPPELYQGSAAVGEGGGVVGEQIPPSEGG